jgi:2-hydroxychromene-2-carboxylate isomerase
MELSRIVRSAMMRRFADAGRDRERREAAESARRRAGRPHRVTYFHQVDDPYSRLAAQALGAFLARYDVELESRVVARPTPIAIHEQTLWDAWAQRDAEAIAPYYGLAFRAASADPAALALARRIAVQAERSPDFAAIAVAIGAALGCGDLAALQGLEQAHGAAAEGAAVKRMDDNFRERHRLGHYLGAMFHYEGDWYWGIDRLHYLEARLDALGARRPGTPAGGSVMLRRKAPASIDSGERVTLEFFASLRSPYTHLAYDRLADLCRRYPVDLVMRPVLPMMMRGVKADRRKGVYILKDAKREADRLGIPFGDIWDPIGEPVRRAYSLFAFARERGRAFEYFHQYSLAVWSERVDAWKETGLRRVVERAGLPWAEARRVLDNRAWEDEFEANVHEMIAAGSWGVPTLRLPATAAHVDFTAWGQDRIWRVEEEIARRLART